MTTDYKERKLKEFEVEFTQKHDALSSGCGGSDDNCDSHPRLSLTTATAFLSSTIDELIGEKEELLKKFVHEVAVVLNSDGLAGTTDYQLSSVGSEIRKRLASL